MLFRSITNIKLYMHQTTTTLWHEKSSTTSVSGQHQMHLNKKLVSQNHYNIMHKSQTISGLGMHLTTLHQPLSITISVSVCTSKKTYPQYKSIKPIAVGYANPCNKMSKKNECSINKQRTCISFPTMSGNQSLENLQEVFVP